MANTELSTNEARGGAHQKWIRILLSVQITNQRDYLCVVHNNYGTWCTVVARAHTHTHLCWASGETVPTDTHTHMHTNTHTHTQQPFVTGLLEDNTQTSYAITVNLPRGFQLPTSHSTVLPVCPFKET